jgi:hypothetical protein
LPLAARDVRVGAPATEAAMKEFTGVKVFTTTLARDREGMGDHIGRWLSDHPDIEVVDKQVTQSSDREFHCLSITFFYRERKKA